MDENERFDFLKRKYADLIEQNGGIDAVLFNMQKKYGITNRLLLLQLFLKENGISAREYITQKQNIQLTTIDEMRVGDRGYLELVFGIPIQEFSYMGCSDYKKIPPGQPLCPDGKPPREMKFVVYTVGQGDWILKAKVGPALNERWGDLSGKKLIVFATMQYDKFTNENVLMIHRIVREVPL